MKKFTEATPDQKKTRPFVLNDMVSHTALNTPLSSELASIPQQEVALPHSPNTTTAITPDPCK